MTLKSNVSVIIAKLSSSGQFLWAKRAGSSGSDRGLGISHDASGNSYVTGVFYNTASFGGDTLTAVGPGGAMFVSKIDPTGQFLWTVNAGEIAAGEDISN